MKLNKNIHPADNMYDKHNHAQYFEIGQSAINIIRLTLSLADPQTLGHKQTILDFPCGYGRISRFLRYEFPNADLFVSDINRDAVDFVAQEFNAMPVYSVSPVSALKLEESFDIIWCGSLLTHLDSHKWGEFILFFLRHLKPNGCLLFTAHGRKSFHYFVGDISFSEELRTDDIKEFYLHKLQNDGFGYLDYPWSPGYGLSFSSCSWVSRFLQQFSSKRVAYFEQDWASNHDVYVMWA